MQNYIYIRKNFEEMVYTFYESIKNETISINELIKIDDFVNTKNGYIVIGDKLYSTIVNVVCKIKTVHENVNLIFCVEVGW